MDTPEPSEATAEKADGVLQRLKAWLYSNRWLMLMALLALGFYFVLDPARFSPVPPCPMYTMTGLECPGCGGQRALHTLLRGDVATAWRLNPLVPLAMPLLGLLLARHIFGPRPKSVQGGPVALWKIAAVIVLLLAFTVYRNLPG